MLFEKKAFHGGSCLSKELEDLGRKIAKRCGGLPLAIVVLDGLVSEKSTTFSEWSKVLDQVSSILSSKDEDNYCSEILALSYYEMPYYLKPCFLYFGLFPEDSIISRKDLIHLWTAEGFIKEEENQSMEQIAEKYLEMLIDRSLIHVAARRTDGGVKSCSIHDCLRALCISKAKNENFFHHISSSPPPNSRRLTGSSDALLEVNYSSVSKVRSILCFGRGTHFISKWEHGVSKDFKLLKILKLEGSSVVQSLPSQISIRIHLRYLGLAGAFLTELSDHIDGFRQARLTLPSSLTKLTLVDTRMKEDIMQILEKLPNLQIL